MNSLLTLYCVHKVNKKNDNNKFFKNNLLSEIPDICIKHHRDYDFLACAVIETQGEKCLCCHDAGIVGQFQRVAFCPQCLHMVYALVFFLYVFQVLLYVEAQLCLVILWQRVSLPCSLHDRIKVTLHELVIVCLCSLQGIVLLLRLFGAGDDGYAHYDYYGQMFQVDGMMYRVFTSV